MRTIADEVVDEQPSVIPTEFIDPITHQIMRLLVDIGLAKLIDLT